MEDADGVSTVYRLLAEESLVPPDPRRAARAALLAVGRGDESPPDGFGSDVERDGAWLRALLPPGADSRALVRAIVRAADDRHTLLVSPTMGGSVMAMVTGRPYPAPGFTLHRTTGDRLVVGEVVPGTPAEKAGLVAGDVVEELGGEPVTLGMEELLYLGALGSGADVQVRGTRGGAPLALTVHLAENQPPLVASRELAGDMGYVRLRGVTTSADPEHDSAELVRRAVTAHAARGVRGLVLDLRSNPGGYGVTRTASVLTDRDPLIVYRNAAGEEEIGTRSGEAAPYHGPLAVLIDEQTLSSAEMVALCLKEQRDARLVGVPTGGGLNVPRQVPLASGSVLMFPARRAVGPVSRSARPDMRLVPDVHVANRTPEDYAAGRDPQLDAAVAALVG